MLGFRDRVGIELVVLAIPVDRLRAKLMGGQEAITDGIEKGFEGDDDAVLLETAAGGTDATAHEHREDRGEEQGLSKGHEGREIRVGETGSRRAAHEIEGDVHRGLIEGNRRMLEMVDEQEAPE